jgi:hypothetical protein
MTLFQSINQSNHQPNSRPSSFFRLRRSVESVPFVRLSRRPLRSGSLRTFLCSFRRDLYRRTHARTRRTKISAALVNECEPSARTSKPVPIPRKNSSRASLAHPIDRSKPIEKPKHRNTETDRNRKTETEKPKSSVFSLDQKEEKSPPTSRRGKNLNLILSPNLTRLSRFCLFRGLGDRRPLPILTNCDSRRNRRSKTDEDDDTRRTDNPIHPSEPNRNRNRCATRVTTTTLRRTAKEKKNQPTGDVRTRTRTRDVELYDARDGGGDDDDRRSDDWETSG